MAKKEKPVIGITGRQDNKFAKKVARRAIQILKRNEIPYVLAAEFKLGQESIPLKDFDCDVVICFGGDGTLLHTFRTMKKAIPVAGVNCGTVGHLTEVNSNQVGRLLEQIISGNYFLENHTRIICEWQNEKSEPALNEIAIAPIKSNMIMRYTIFLNEKLLFNDLADGLIISTPTGSTAHALSAGGPLVDLGVNAVVIVPVNSTDKNKRPIVVPDNAEIKVSNIASKDKIEVVSDGHIHKIISDEALVHKTKNAIFLRLPKEAHREFSDSESLTPSSRFILEVLNHHGMMTQNEIAKHTGMPLRTIRRSLSSLLKKGIIAEKNFLLNEKVKGYILR
jgi:NAD+ kinase